MKIVLLLCSFIIISLHADVKEQMLKLYKAGSFEASCELGYSQFEANKRDEEFISLYSFACLEADFIDRLSVPSVTLRFSKEARANAAYFAVILMQKKLLYHALLDNYDLSIYTLPSTDYILSKVFDLYTKQGKQTPQESYTFRDEKDPQRSYKLYVTKNDTVAKIVIEEYHNGSMLKRHIYW